MKKPRPALLATAFVAAVVSAFAQFALKALAYQQVTREPFRPPEMAGVD